jgi:hypothetical protein
MNTSHPVLLPRSWLIFSIIVGFVLAVGTAVLSSISTHELAQANAQLDEQLRRLHQRVENAPALTTQAGQQDLTRITLNAAAVTRRAEFFQRVSLCLLIAACTLGGTAAILLRHRMKQLESMITVCAWTKRVKFNNEWMSFEDYLQARFNFQFTHGISEEAAAKMRLETAELVKEASRAAKSNSALHNHSAIKAA